MIASLILATLKATFLLAVLAIAMDIHFDHHFITDLVFEALTSPSKATNFCLIFYYLLEVIITNDATTQDHNYSKFIIRLELSVEMDFFVLSNNSMRASVRSNSFSLFNETLYTEE